MEDKSKLYILSIVGIVAIVGILVIIIGFAGKTITSTEPDYSGLATKTADISSNAQTKLDEFTLTGTSTIIDINQEYTTESIYTFSNQ